MSEAAAATAPTLNTSIEPAAATGSEKPVDETSTISPKSDATHLLEDRLGRRPEAKDLVDRNILHGTTSASLQQHQDELKHAMITDNLKKGLAARPTREELEERGILPDDHIAPALLSHKKELEKSMLTDGLNAKLARRPTIEQITEKGILSADEDPRTVQ